MGDSEILRRGTRVSGVGVEDNRHEIDQSSEASSLVLKPTLESIWSLPQDHLRTRDKNQGLGRVEAAAYNPENGEVLVAADGELVLWKVDFELGKGDQNQRKTSVRIHSEPSDADGHAHHDGVAASVVRQIYWVDWLHEGTCFFVLTVPHELRVYRSGLELVGIHKLHSRHILCLALHNERHEACIACADGTMKRFGVTSTRRWEGLGLGYRHSVLQDDFHELKTWHAEADPNDNSRAMAAAKARSPSPSRWPSGDEDVFWVASLFCDEERDRLFGCCGLDVHVWRWETGEVLAVLPGLHKQPITGCWLSPVPPQPLVTSSRDGTLRVWKYSGGAAKLMETLEGHERGVFGMCYDESSGCLFSFGDDGVVMCWNLQRITYVHHHALYKPAPSFLALALGKTEEGTHKSLYVEARNSGNVASGTIQMARLPKQRCGNSSFDDDGNLKGDKRSGTGLLVIMGTEVDVLEVQTDRLFLAASLGAVQHVAIAHAVAPRPRLPFRAATAILDIKSADAAIGRIQRGSVGLVLCVDGSVQLFGCSSGEICAVMLPALRYPPPFTPDAKLNLNLSLGRKGPRRWKHTRGEVGWELTQSTREELRRRRERASRLGDEQDHELGGHGSGSAAERMVEEEQEDWQDSEQGQEKEQEREAAARGREGLGDAKDSRREKEERGAESELGAALVCEFNMQAGVLLLAWERGTVRLLDINDGRIVDEIKEDPRSMKGGVKVTGACLVVSVETDAPAHDRGSRRGSTSYAGGGSECRFAARESRPDVAWSRWRVARGRSDGQLDLSEVLAMEGVAGAQAGRGPRSHGAAGASAGEQGGQDGGGFSLSGTQIAARIKSGESAVAVVRWLSKTQTLKLFRGCAWLEDDCAAARTSAGALLAAASDGVFTLWGFRVERKRSRDVTVEGQRARKEEVEWSMFVRVPTVREADGLGGLTCAAPSELHHGCVVCGFGCGSVQVWRLGAVKGDRFSQSVVNAKEEARMAPNAFDSRKGALVVMDYHMDAVVYCECSPDGVVVVTLSADKGVAEWNVKDGSLLQTIPNTPPISSVTYTMIPRNRGTNVLLRRTSIAVAGSESGPKPLGAGDSKVGGDEMVIIVGIGNEVNVLPSMYKEVQSDLAWRWRDRVLARKGTSRMLSGVGAGSLSATGTAELEGSRRPAIAGNTRRGSLLLALGDQGSFDSERTRSEFKLSQPSLSETGEPELRLRESVAREPASEEDPVQATFAHLDAREAVRRQTLHRRATTIQCWWRCCRARWRFQQVMRSAREKREAHQLQGEAGREEGERLAEERKAEEDKMEELRQSSVFAFLGFDEIRGLAADATRLDVAKGVVLMERGPGRERGNWGFGGGVFLVVQGMVQETVDVLFEGREQNVEVRTVGAGELFGEMSMWGGGEACGDLEWVTTQTACVLIRVPALRMKQRLNAHAAREWGEIVKSLEEAKQSRVAEERRSCEQRFGRPGGSSLSGRRKSVVSLASDVSAGGMSQAGSSSGGFNRAGSSVVRRRGSVARRGSVSWDEREAPSQGGVGRVASGEMPGSLKIAEHGPRALEVMSPMAMSVRSADSTAKEAVGHLERTGAAELARYGVSIPMQLLPDTWAKERVGWRGHSFEGMSKEDRDMVTDLQIVTMADQNEQGGHRRASLSPARMSLNAHRHEIYLGAVRSSPRAGAHSTATAHDTPGAAQAGAHACAAGPGSHADPQAAHRHHATRGLSAVAKGALGKGALPGLDSSASRPGTGLSTARTAPRPNSAMSAGEFAGAPARTATAPTKRGQQSVRLGARHAEGVTVVPPESDRESVEEDANADAASAPRERERERAAAMGGASERASAWASVERVRVPAMSPLRTGPPQPLSPSGPPQPTTLAAARPASALGLTTPRRQPEQPRGESSSAAANKASAQSEAFGSPTIPRPTNASSPRQASTSRPVSPFFRREISPAFLRHVARNLAPTALQTSSLRRKSVSSASGSWSFEADSTASSASLLRRGLPFAVSNDRAGCDKDHADATPSQDVSATVNLDACRNIRMLMQPEAFNGRPSGLRASDIMIGPGYLRLTREQLLARKPWHAFRSDARVSRPASPASNSKPTPHSSSKPKPKPNLKLNAARPSAKSVVGGSARSASALPLEGTVAAKIALDAATAGEYSPWGGLPVDEAAQAGQWPGPAPFKLRRAETSLGLGVREYDASDAEAAWGHGQHDHDHGRALRVSPSPVASQMTVGPGAGKVYDPHWQADCASDEWRRLGSDGDVPAQDDDDDDDLNRGVCDNPSLAATQAALSGLGSGQTRGKTRMPVKVTSESKGRKRSNADLPVTVAAVQNLNHDSLSPGPGQRSRTARPRLSRRATWTEGSTHAPSQALMSPGPSLSRKLRRRREGNGEIRDGPGRGAVATGSGGDPDTIAFLSQEIPIPQ